MYNLLVSFYWRNRRIDDYSRFQKMGIEDFILLGGIHQFDFLKNNDFNF
jgi:hypothetical protein